MPKPFPLQTVLDLMQARSDEATQQLARLIANERDAKTKLELLSNYRNDYALRFTQAAQNGLSQREWHNYREFLNRLDEAIDLQKHAVAQHDGGGRRARRGAPCQGLPAAQAGECGDGGTAAQQPAPARLLRLRLLNGRHGAWGRPCPCAAR